MKENIQKMEILCLKDNLNFLKQQLKVIKTKNKKRGDEISQNRISEILHSQALILDHLTRKEHKLYSQYKQTSIDSYQTKKAFNELQSNITIVNTKLKKNLKNEQKQSNFSKFFSIKRFLVQKENMNQQQLM